MELAQRVGPALLEQPRIGRLGLGQEQGVLHPPLWLIGVGVSRNDIIVAGQHDRRIERDELGGELLEPRHPRQLAIELRTRPGIAVGQVEATDQHAIDGRFEVAAVAVVGIAGEPAPSFLGNAIAGQNGNPVPALLPVPDGAVAGLLQRRRREALVGALEFLEAGDIGGGRLQPLQQHRQPAVDAVDVEGGDAHHGATRQCRRGCRRNAPWRDDFLNLFN